MKKMYFIIMLLFSLLLTSCGIDTKKNENIHNNNAYENSSQKKKINSPLIVKDSSANKKINNTIASESSVVKIEKFKKELKKKKINLNKVDCYSFKDKLLKEFCINEKIVKWIKLSNVIVVNNSWNKLNKQNNKQDSINIKFVKLVNSWDYEWIKNIECSKLNIKLQGFCKKTKYFINNNKNIDKEFVKLISSWDYEWIKNIECNKLNIKLQELCKKTKYFINNSNK